MKKLIAILLIPIFLLTTAGVAITSLYCNGKISDIGINVKACCKDVNKGGCCNTTTKIIKVDDDYVSTSPTFEIAKIIALALPSFQVVYVSEVTSNSNNTVYWDKAPPSLKEERYILFHSLII